MMRPCGQRPNEKPTWAVLTSENRARNESVIVSPYRLALSRMRCAVAPPPFHDTISMRRRHRSAVLWQQCLCLIEVKSLLDARTDGFSAKFVARPVRLNVAL